MQKVKRNIPYWLHRTITDARRALKDEKTRDFLLSHTYSIGHMDGIFDALRLLAEGKFYIWGAERIEAEIEI